MKRNLLIALTLLLSLALAAPAFAGKKKKADKAEDKKTDEAAMHMPKPAPELDKLAFMLGKFNTVETHEPSMHIDKKWTAKGLEHNRKGPGGFSVISNYASKSEHGEFKGHGMLVWDAKSKTYRNYWTDSMGPNVETADGKWANGKLVFTSSGEWMGKAYESKMVYTPTDSGYSMEYHSTMGSEDGSLKKMMSIVATKKAESAMK